MTDRYVAMCVPGRTDGEPGHYYVYDRTGQRSRPAADLKVACNLAVAMNLGIVIARLHLDGDAPSNPDLDMFRVYYPTGHVIEVEASDEDDAVERAREVQS